MVRYVTQRAQFLQQHASNAAAASTSGADAHSSQPTALEFASHSRRNKWLVKKSMPGMGHAAFGSITLASTSNSNSTSSSSSANIVSSSGSSSSSKGSIAKGGDAKAGKPSSPQGESTPKGLNSNLVLLPIGATRGNTLLHYVWDGKNIVAVDEAVLERGYDGKGKFVQWLSTFQDRVQHSFLPNTNDVSPDYWEWLRWRLTQRFFSSTLQNLSTQSLLMALGMGAKKTIAASAAINWLLKDGVGRIARMVVSTQYGRSFDSDLKRIRVSTSVIFEATIGCEFLTPFFPQHFLVLASISNIGKAVALSAFVATQPAFQQALCVGGNLADVTAKGQAMHMTIDMMALLVSAAVIHMVGNDPRRRMVIPLMMFPVLGAADLFSMYQEVKSVQLKSLNRERAEMAIEEYLRSGKIPNSALVASKEHMILPPDIDGGFLPSRIVPVNKLLRTPEDLPPLLQRYKRSNFMVKLMPPESGHSQGPKLPWSKPGPQILVSFSEKAGVSEMLQALLEVGHLRFCIRREMLAKAGSSSSLASGMSWQSIQQSMDQKSLEAIQVEAQQRASKGRAQLMRVLDQQGWKTNRLLLNNHERSTYHQIT